jgi:hypothetical protein
MQRKKKNPPTKYPAKSKQGTGVSNHRTSFGPPRTFHTSPSLGHHMLSSTVADTKQSATSKMKPVLTTVSPGMKQRVSSGSIDNGFGYGYGFDLPDDISDLDGLAKIVQPSIINSASSVYFDHQLCSPPLPTVIPHISVTSHCSSSRSSATTHPTKKVAPSATFPYSYATRNSSSEVNPIPPTGTPTTATTLSALKQQTSYSSARGYTLKPHPLAATSTNTTLSCLKSLPSNVLKPRPPPSSLKPTTPSSLKQPLHSDQSSSSPTLKFEDHQPSVTSLSYLSSLKGSPPLPSSATSHKTSSTTTNSKKAPTSTISRLKKPPMPHHSKSYNKGRISLGKSSSEMSIFDSPFSATIECTIPSFTGPVSSSFLGSSAYNSIDLMSSSDEECSDTMPDLVDPCKHQDSSSDEECSGVIIGNNAKATRRSTRILPTVLLPSYFEGKEVDDDDDDDDEGEVYDDEDPPTFGTNRVMSYAKVRKRSKKKSTKQCSINRINNPNESVEHHRAGSRMWSSPLCPKGICLVVQTTTEVHVVQDCPAGQVYVFRQLSSLVHLQQVESKLASYLKAGFASDFPVLLYRMNQNHFSSFCVILNDPDSNSPIIDSIEFTKLNRLLVEVNPMGVYGCLRQARRSSISYGFASSRCTHRDETGTTVPNLLKNTLEPVVQNLFVAMSSIFGLDGLPTWAKYLPDANRLPFAETIDPGNLLEGLTIHLTNHDNLLQPHKDVHNPAYLETSQLSLVVGASRWVDGNRIGATGYFRKSVSESMVRSNVTAPLLEELTTVYTKLPPHRRHCNPSTFEVAHKDGCHLDTNHFSIPCNIDPMGKFV